MTDPTPPSPSPPISNADSVPCASCGYDLRGIAVGSVCPECSTPVVQVGTAQQTSGKAIASMVLGIASLVTCAMYGIPGIVCGIIAVVFARKADIAIQTGTAPVTSAGMAKAGRICGWIGIGLGSLYLVLIVVWIIAAIMMA